MSLKYPIGCTTDTDRGQYRRRLKENLKDWYNAKVKGMDLISARKFFLRYFRPLAMEMERLINESANADGLIKIDGMWQKDEHTLTDKWNPPVSDLSYVDPGEGEVFDPTEDLNTYNENDPNGYLFVDGPGNRVTFSNLPRDEPTARIYQNKGPAFFPGNYDQLLTVFMGALSQNQSVAIPWMLANVAKDYSAMLAANDDAHSIILNRTVGGAFNFITEETEGGIRYSDVAVISGNTPYYPENVRDESIGTFGQLVTFIFSNAGRSVLFDTLSVLLHAKIDFSTILAANTFAAVPPFARLFIGYMEFLDLQLAAIIASGNRMARNVGIKEGFRKTGSSVPVSLGRKGGFSNDLQGLLCKRGCAANRIDANVVKLTERRRQRLYSAA